MDDGERLRGLLGELSPRERAVLLGILDGRTSRAIAGNLGISHRTVEVHSARLRRKLGLASRQALRQHAPELVAELARRGTE